MMDAETNELEYAPNKFDGLLDYIWDHMVTPREQEMNKGRNQARYCLERLSYYGDLANGLLDKIGRS